MNGWFMASKAACLLIGCWSCSTAGWLTFFQDSFLADGLPVGQAGWPMPLRLQIGAKQGCTTLYQHVWSDECMRQGTVWQLDVSFMSSV